LSPVPICLLDVLSRFNGFPKFAKPLKRLDLSGADITGLKPDVNDTHKKPGGK
jgi:hypothetical protein